MRRNNNVILFMGPRVSMSHVDFKNAKVARLSPRFMPMSPDFKKLPCCI